METHVSDITNDGWFCGFQNTNTLTTVYLLRKDIIFYLLSITCVLIECPGGKPVLHPINEITTDGGTYGWESEVYTSLPKVCGHVLVDHLILKS